MTCGRVWEAEAIEDGRLEAASVASFERHAAACIDCRNALQRLTRLREGRALLEPLRLSPFEHRRRRAALLRRANSEALHPPRGRSFFVLLSAAAALVGALVVVRFERDTTAPARSAATVAATEQPRFELRPIGAAEWHDATVGSLGRVVLAAGTLGVHVEHLANGQRFVLSLPDGELEVHGTRFIVEVKDGHTERVLVTEGVVSLRLESGRQRTLIAGESYVTSSTVARESLDPLMQREVQKTPSSSVAVGAHGSSVPPRSARPPAHDVSPATAATGPESGTSSTNARADFASVPRADGDAAAGEAFHRAMAAFSLGAYAEADERLAEFAARFPNDSRDEDAAFLRTVIALRRGDPAAAVARAHSYLRLFPDGLRRPEVERMLDAAKSP